MVSRKLSIPMATHGSNRHDILSTLRDIWTGILVFPVLKGGGALPETPKLEHIFVAVITFFPFPLCKYF